MQTHFVQDAHTERRNMGKKQVTPADALKEKLNQIDTYQLNHSYREEKYVFALIQAGDVRRIKELLKRGQWSYPKPVKDAFKNLEYMLVSTVGVITRVVIEADVPPRVGFLYSDMFLARISECTTEEELLDVYEQIAVTYTELVKQFREQASGNYLVLRSKKYIYDHLLDKLSLSILSEQMGVSAEHLARCFKAETGMTVSQYIAQKKVDLAADLLVDTNRSVNEIAFYLQFQSTSYFIKLFKREKHMTPMEYRNPEKCTLKRF